MSNIRDVELMAHLMRRAGFGATLEDLNERVHKGYERTIDDLFSAGNERSMGDDLVRRFHHELSGLLGGGSAGEHWLYHLITTKSPLKEKMVLFWHNIFATGYAKVVHSKQLADQTRMFREHGMGNFKTLLVELSKDPSMIIWLDNQDNHRGAINENYGRELLELFSMGVGNYTEKDVKECARAFTGWSIGNREYMETRSMRDSDWPYGRISWHFEYIPEDHDYDEKEFLGQSGRFNGEDIIDIICQQPATARFISRYLYHFFVADEPPVPQWPYVAPRDPEAIKALTKVYFESNYNIHAMLHMLFNSKFFKSEKCWYEKVKSPAELVSGIIRMTGEFDRPRLEITERWLQLQYMGQKLNNPPSVEGWPEGTEWIETGSLLERVNFASSQMSDISKPGILAIVQRILISDNNFISPKQLVDRCLDEMGALRVTDETQSTLLSFATQLGDVKSDKKDAPEKVSEMLKITASTIEFQRA